MVRQRIQIKKIDNITARQVTFSKRRRGLFKKAQELSTLCDVDVALIVFSSTGKLFDYSNSSMKQAIERYNLHSKNLGTLSHPSLELQLEKCDHAMLKKEIAKRTQELRHLRGEELHGLDLEELTKLEKTIEGGLSRVTMTKGEKYQKEISFLMTKAAKLREENLLLKQEEKARVTNINVCQTHQALEKGESSESITNNCSLADPPQDTSLKLGLPFPN